MSLRLYGTHRPAYFQHSWNIRTLFNIGYGVLVISFVTLWQISWFILWPSWSQLCLNTHDLGQFCMELSFLIYRVINTVRVFLIRVYLHLIMRVLEHSATINLLSTWFTLLRLFPPSLHHTDNILPSCSQLVFHHSISTIPFHFDQLHFHQNNFHQFHHPPSHRQHTAIQLINLTVGLSSINDVIYGFHAD